MKIRKIGIYVIIASIIFFGMDYTVLRVIAAKGFSNSHPNTWKNTGDQAYDITRIALTQVGYKETGNNHTKYNYWSNDGQDVAQQWCATFISWCANQAGIPESVIKKSDWAGSNKFGVTQYKFSDVQANVGDIAFINNDEDSLSDHVGLVYAIDEKWIYTVEGNTSSGKCQTQKYAVNSGYINGYTASGVNILYYGRPNYTKANVLPEGNLDSISGQEGSIILRGWSYDPNDYSQVIDIEVYVGGDIGIGKCYRIKANNEERPDVKQYFPGVNVKCGFDYTIPVEERGKQNVYVYAVDPQDPNLKRLVDYGAREVTIAGCSPVGNLDSISAGEGTITLRGWAYDPDAYEDSLVIEVYVGGDIGTGHCYRVMADNESRPDVTQYFPKVKEMCGFTYTIATEEKGHQYVYVYAVDPQYPDQKKLVDYGQRDVVIKGQEPVGNLDSISVEGGKINLRGWAYDSDDYSKDIEIEVYVGGDIGFGSCYKIMTGAESRPDVTQYFQEVKDKCGFNSSIQVNERGLKQVYVYAVDAQKPEQKILVDYGIREITIEEQLPIGNLDSANGGAGVIELRGWAYDPDDYSKDIEIEVYVGGDIGSGTCYKTITGSEARPDVTQYFPEVKDTCGFICSIGVEEVGLQHIYVYAVDTHDSAVRTLIDYGEREVIVTK